MSVGTLEVIKEGVIICLSVYAFVVGGAYFIWWFITRD